MTIEVGWSVLKIDQYGNRSVRLGIMVPPVFEEEGFKPPESAEIFLDKDQLFSLIEILNLIYPRMQCTIK